MAASTVLVTIDEELSCSHTSQYTKSENLWLGDELFNRLKPLSGSQLLRPVHVCPFWDFYVAILSISVTSVDRFKAIEVRTVIFFV